MTLKMTTDNHPITPPPEMVEQWHIEAMKGFRDNGIYEHDIATQATRWGADQELEACCADLRMVLGPNQADWLRSVRRPKPPSLKEQALEELYAAERSRTVDYTIIRRALESLPE